MDKLSRRKALGGAVLLGGAGLALWRGGSKRHQPAAVREPLFDGIIYERQTKLLPRPMVLHWLEIDLGRPSIRFLVTPRKVGEKLPLVGKKTTQFLAEQGCQVAVNADFFSPWRSNSVWDYYPHVGDPVGVEGDAASEGVVYATRPEYSHLTTLWIGKDNAVTIGTKPPAMVWNACGGHVIPLGGAADDTELSPRVAVGVSGKTLWILLIDGRQKGYSEGATVRDLAEAFRARGATAAINLDGGGSATMVAAGRGILNSPIDNHIPGRERPVANHLGIFAGAIL